MHAAALPHNVLRLEAKANAHTQPHPGMLIDAHTQHAAQTKQSHDKRGGANPLSDAGPPCSYPMALARAHASHVAQQEAVTG